MNEQLHIDAEGLADEIARHLAVVGAFRAVDCEPTWRPDPTEPTLEQGTAERSIRIEASAH